MTGHFEGVKCAYRQSKDGVVVSFVIHPNDVPADLATAPLGTIYMIGFAQVNPDAGDAPTREDGVAGAQGDSCPAPVAVTSPATSPKPKGKWSDLKPSAQAGIRCEDVDYRAFLSEQYAGALRRNKNDAAETVRYICIVSSRASLDIDRDALRRWQTLEGEFEDWLSSRRAAQQFESHGANRG